MKKKKLKHLSLKKRTISNLNGSKIQNPNQMGGQTTGPCIITTTLVTEAVSWILGGCEGGGDGGSVTPTRGCETDSCEETFTCPDYSCFCQYN